MKYFSISELARSETAMRLGINNVPDGITVARLRALVESCLDPLREAWGAPIIVSSGYRCPRLNKVVGGAINSQHVTGEAADIHTLSDLPAENRKLFELAQSLGLPFDQLIDEYGYNWVHISCSPRHRRQVLHLPRKK